MEPVSAAHPQGAFWGTFFDLNGIEQLSHLPNLLLLVEVLALLWLAKKVFGWLLPFDLEFQLVKADNKAVTLSFVGYMVGVALVVEGVLETADIDLITSLLDLLVWGVIGIGLLNLAASINNRWILPGINNRLEKLERSNLAVAVVEAGSFVGSGLITRAIVKGEPLGWLWDLSFTLLYFALGQLGFVAFGWLYGKATSYDYKSEIAQANVAAGISFGMTLAALGGLVAAPLAVSYSLLLFLAWFVVGSATLAFFRFVMDKVIIPSERLDHEIHDDRNWGIALLEGSFALIALLFLQALFLP